MAEVRDTMINDRDRLMVELYRHRWEGVAEEMGQALTRAALSPNIKERRDHSCALFDAAGGMIAQAAHIPVHLGAAPRCVQAVIAHGPPADGETWIVNDPYAGGTHLPDITLVTPVSLGDGVRMYVATRAHHADVGGISPGSLPLSTDIHQEGWRCPPQPLTDDLVHALCRASRTPDERLGDLAAQRAANALGVRRVQSLAASFGAERCLRQIEALVAYTRERVRAWASRLPQHTEEHRAFLDDARGTGGPVALRLRLTTAPGHLCFDFSESDAQVAGPMNAPRAIVDAAVVYALLCMVGGDLPANAGVWSVVETITRPGTLVDPLPPAAVAAGNVETSQRLVDLCFDALAKLFPGDVPASSYGTMNNLLIGSLPGATRAFVSYETLGGGHGGGPRGPGASGMQAHMTNTLNTPIEALEHAFPLRVWAYGLRRGSGGQGQHPGGEGLVREIEVLEPAEVTLLGERRRFPPPGREGGEDGAPGVQYRVAPSGERTQLPGKATFTLQAGERVRVETPGGGGWRPAR